MSRQKHNSLNVEIDLTPVVNFTNILCKAFHAQIPKAQKKTESLTVFFALLGSVLVKAARKILVK